MDLLTETVYLLILVQLALGNILVTGTFRASLFKLPPGPWRIPVIGNLHQPGAKLHQSLAKLAQTHGPIMSLRLGRVTAIFISSAPAAKQAMQKQDNLFANRAVPDALNACNHADSSVIWLALSPKWRESRKLMNSQIFNSQKMEASASKRQQKVKELVDDVRTRCALGEGVLIGEAAFKTTLNSTTLFSMNFDSEKARDFKESFQEVMELAGIPNIVDYFPWMRRFDPQRYRAQMEIQFGKMLAFLDSIIGERLTGRAEQGSSYENRDMLDTFLDISETNEEINGEVIRQLLVSLLVAGTDTSSVTVEWAMSEMLKIRANFRQRKASPGSGYRAFAILTSHNQRNFQSSPTSLITSPTQNPPRSRPVGLQNPQRSTSSDNAWAISRDPSTWDDTTVFKPERFLNSDMDFRGASFELIPFGAGRRICPGLPLAHKRLPSCWVHWSTVSIGSLEVVQIPKT